MWSLAILRLLRRRVVLGLILTVSLFYCIFSYIEKVDFLDGDEIVPVRRKQPFIWRTLQEHQNTTNNDADVECRNSVQGKVLIVDERGFVCPRHEILTSGCCNNDDNDVVVPSRPVAGQYLCETCKSNNCCAIYEYCISCCLHPDKKDMLQHVLGKATEQNSVLFASVSDHFELCLAKCRTNSQSVQHENSYKDPRAKHCFGELAPAIQSTDNDV